VVEKKTGAAGEKKRLGADEKLKRLGEKWPQKWSEVRKIFWKAW
jgi:hypothetical protein